MSQTKGIRWPTDLEGVVEALAKEDDRTFSAEAVYLVRLGIKEREILKRYEESRYESRMMAAEVSVKYGSGAEPSSKESAVS